MPTMVRSLVACHAKQAERRAANAAVAAAMVCGASSSPPSVPAHSPVLPRPSQNGHHRGNGDGEEHLLTPTVDNTVVIFDSIVATSGLPTTALSATTTITATTPTPASNDNCCHHHFCPCRHCPRPLLPLPLPAFLLLPILVDCHVCVAGIVFVTRCILE